MKILVTVGTTPFDELIKACDNFFALKGDFQVVAQTGNGLYSPKYMTFFDFTDDIEKYYQWSDLIICHAGAGTVYKLLEKEKKMIVVPNLKRRESHQLDICRFLQENGLAMVLESLDDIRIQIKNIQNMKFEKYNKEENQLAEAIYQIIVN